MGKSYQSTFTISEIGYTRFMKHLCPNCKKRLRITKGPSSTTTISFNGGVIPEERTIVHKETGEQFYCPNCLKKYSIDEMKKLEGIDEKNPTKEYKMAKAIDKIAIALLYAFLIAIFVAMVYVYYAYIK